MTALPPPGQSLLWLGGNIDIRVHVDTGLGPESGGLWDSGEWDTAVWGSSDPAWYDLSRFVLSVDTTVGAERWGERFATGSAMIVVDNTTGIFTPESTTVKPWYLPFRPGRRIRIVAYPWPDEPDEAVPLFTGVIDATVDSYAQAGFDSTTTIMCLDNMAVLAAFNPAALGTPTGEQSTDDRVNAALDRIGWPEDDRYIEAGDHSVQSSFLAQSTLEECQRAADAEGGAFYCDAAGTPTFRARDWLTTREWSVNPWGFLGYPDLPEGDGEYAAHVLDWKTSWDSARIVNQTGFARKGGTMQAANDVTSQALYGIRTYQRTDLQNTDDSQVLFLAERYMQAFKDNRMRVNAVTITALDDPDNLNLNELLFGSMLGDCFDVRIASGTGWEVAPRLTQAFGISHRITADDWTVTLALDDQRTVPVYDRAELVASFDPVAWWQFTESSGTATADASGNGHGLTWAGGASLVGTGGPNGTGLVTLDGTDDYATVTAEAALELRQDMTLEFWLKPAEAESKGGIITVRGTTPLYETYSGPLEPGLVLIWFYPTSSAGSASGLPVPADEWSHLAVTVEWTGGGRVIRRYLNGQKYGADTATTYTPGTETRAVNVGRRATDGDEYYLGSIGELVVYDRVLSSDNIQSLYASAYT